MTRWLPGSDDLRGWRRLYVGAVAVMVALHILDVFVRPWLNGAGDLVIHDDARQFLSWMPRLLDPQALPGDWLADFWEAVSPPGYQALYRAAATLGLAPTVTARLLSVALLGMSGVAAWRLARAIDPRPAVAACAAGFLMAFLSKEDAIFSATPRGVAVPAILFFLEGIVRRSWWTTGAAAAVLALVYPAPAATLLTMLGLSRIDWRRVRLLGGWRDAAALAAIGALTAVLVIAFKDHAGAWGPVLTLDQARTMPALMTPGARSAIVGADGTIDYLCSMRTGFLPEVVPCGRGVPLATLGNLLFLAPLLWLAWRGARDGGPNRLYAWALAAALPWFVLASLLAFHLHLPSRFSQRVLYPLEWLAIGQVIGGALRATGPTMGQRIGTVATALFLAVAFATPLAMLQQPTDRRAVAEARAMPAGTRIGGVSDDLQFLPALTGRAITASPQHAVPWETGYYRLVRAALGRDLTVVSTADPELLRAALAQSGADYLLVAPAVLAGKALPDDYRRAVPGLAARAERQRRTAPLLPGLAPRCTPPDSSYIDVACLRAQLPAPGRKQHSDPVPASAHKASP